MAITSDDLVAQLGLDIGDYPEDRVELDRWVDSAVGYVEEQCGAFASNTSRGRVAAMESAVLVIVRHLWETRRGRGAVPGMTIPGDGSAVTPRFGIPNAAVDIMRPYLRPVLSDGIS